MAVMTLQAEKTYGCRKCPDCGLVISVGSEVCPYCGKKF